MFDRSDEKWCGRPAGATAGEARRFGDGVSITDEGRVDQHRSKESGVDPLDRLIEMEAIEQRQIGVVLWFPRCFGGMPFVVVLALRMPCTRVLPGVPVVVVTGEEVVVVQPPGVDMVSRAKDLLPQTDHRHHGQQVTEETETESMVAWEVHGAVFRQSTLLVADPADRDEPGSQAGVGGRNA